MARGARVNAFLPPASRQKRLREGQVGDADEMRGYTSVLSLLRLITLQLSNLGAQLDGWHDTMYVLLSWPGFKAVHLVGCVD